MKSFTRAAESLGLPKASVSTHVQQLENEVGTRLLQRTTRSVQLTQDGMVFYERCKDILSDMDELSSMFQAGDHEVSGRIRVDMPSRFARFTVIPRLHEFLEKHPRIEIELGSTDREVDLVHEGYDCVIRVGNMEDSSLIAKKLGEHPVISCASADYVKKYGRPKKVEDLAKHLLVHYAYAFGVKPEGFEYFDGQNYQTISMAGNVTVNNAEAYVAACLGGLGIIQAPLTSLEKYLKEKTLIEILPEFRSEPMPIYLLYPHQRNLSRRVKVFMNWIEGITRSKISAVTKA